MCAQREVRSVVLGRSPFRFIATAVIHLGQRLLCLCLFLRVFTLPGEAQVELC